MLHQKIKTQNGGAYQCVCYTLDGMLWLHKLLMHKENHQREDKKSP